MTKLLMNSSNFVDACTGNRALNLPVGSSVDNHGTWYLVFISTDSEGKIRRSKNGNVILNYRKQRARNVASGEVHVSA